MRTDTAVKPIGPAFSVCCPFNLGHLLPGLLWTLVHPTNCTVCLVNSLLNQNQTANSLLLNSEQYRGAGAPGCHRTFPNTNQSSMLHNSYPFKCRERGAWLNGSNLKVSSGGGSEVKEYIIGNEEYSLRPWLLTPYQLESNLSDSDSKVEFNKRLNSVTTAVALRALGRLKDTWKCLQGEGWRPNNQLEAYWTVHTCCILHNIVIDMEEDGVGMPSDEEYNRIKQVWHVADEEEGVRARDILSQHLIESGAHTVAAEEEQEAVVVASGSGDKNKEQEVHRAQPADRGKEKVHGS